MDSTSSGRGPHREPAGGEKRADGTGADEARLADRAGESARPVDDPPEAAGSPLPVAGQRARVAARQGALDTGVRDARLPGVRSGADDVVSSRTGRGLRESGRRQPHRITSRGNEDEPVAREQLSTDANDEVPSVALTTKFLSLCQQYGSEQLAVSIVYRGTQHRTQPRRAGVAIGQRLLDGVEHGRELAVTRQPARQGAGDRHRFRVGATTGRAACRGTCQRSRWCRETARRPGSRATRRRRR